MFSMVRHRLLLSSRSLATLGVSRYLNSFNPQAFIESLPSSYFSNDNAPQKFLRCYPEYSPEFTAVLEAFKGATCEKIEYEDSFVNLINVHTDPLARNAIPFSNFIIERSFYEELFTLIRKEKKCILSGNEGTGKSVFEFYYLYRLCQAAKHGNTSPSQCNGIYQAS